MRITPTQDQMSYLTSVGVAKETISQPDGSFPAASRAEHAGSPSRDSSVHWWAVAIIIAMLTVLVAGLARGQTNPPRRQAILAQSDRTAPVSPTVRLATSAQSSKTVPAGPNGRRADPAALKNHGPAANSPEWLQASRQATPSPSHLAGPKNQIQSLEQRLPSQQTRLADSLDGIRDAIQARSRDAAGAVEELEHKVHLNLTSKSAALDSRIDSQDQIGWRVIVWGAISSGAVLLLIAIGSLQVKQHMRRIAEAIMAHSASLAEVGSASEENGSGPAAPTDVQGPALLGHGPKRPEPKRIPEPHEAMREMTKAGKRLPRISKPPEPPEGTWTLGLATVKGNVRTENQDYGLCFRVADHDVLIVADGCGGIKHGKLAAYLAATSAAASVAFAYGVRRRWHVPRVEDVAIKAINEAAHTLAFEGDKLNITDVNGGLRTTLIVVIGNKRDIGFAYIGDGGGCAIKTSAEPRHFLDPQKANDFAMNVLAASLGPQMEGEPVSGVMTRDPGDLVMVGSDGVFDRVGPDFPRDVLRGCIQHQGKLQDVADRVVAELATMRDDAGYICDDNLSLGLMGDGSAPKLSEGFWSSNQTEVEITDPSPTGKEEDCVTEAV